MGIQCWRILHSRVKNEIFLKILLFSQKGSNPYKTQNLCIIADPRGIRCWLILHARVKNNFFWNFTLFEKVPQSLKNTKLYSQKYIISVFYNDFGTFWKKVKFQKKNFFVASGQKFPTPDSRKIHKFLCFIGILALFGKK